MCAMCNIPSYIEDPSYRYKMPKLTTRIEGRGNGIKTNMVNVCDIARSLKTNPAYITKFIGGELGAQSKYSFEEDQKGKKEEKSIVNGAHETSTGQQLIDKFIDKFVLCPNCKLPETDMRVKKGFLCAKCKACGWSGDLDNGHKLVKFILQNEKKAKKKEKKEVEEARPVREGRPQRERPAAVERAPVDAAAESVESQDKKDKKDKKEKKEKKKDKKNRDKDEESGEDDDSDKDGDAEDSRRGSKAAEGDDLTFTDEVIKESVARVRKLIQEAEGKGKPMGTEKFFDEVRMIQIQNSFSYKLRLYVVLEGCFGDDMLPKTLKAKMPYVKKMVSTPPMVTKDILHAFEVYYVENPKNRKQYPMCLKELYESDVLPEAALQKHYGSSLDTEGFADAKAAAKPFLEWLAQEDSESESGSDDASDVGVEDI